MTDLFDEPSRRCLKVDAWPPADRRAWQIMLREGHVLDNPGLVSHWSPATRHKNRRGYGRWLTFVSSEGGIDRSHHPADRVTRHALRQYLRLLQEQRLAPYTIVARIDELRAVISAMAPDRGWQWLIDLVTRLRRQAKPATNKRTRLVPSVDLFHWGVCCMDTVKRTMIVTRVCRPCGIGTV